MVRSRSQAACDLQANVSCFLEVCHAEFQLFGGGSRCIGFVDGRRGTSRWAACPVLFLLSGAADDSPECCRAAGSEERDIDRGPVECEPFKHGPVEYGTALFV
jgi:hypothetical protein